MDRRTSQKPRGCLATQSEGRPSRARAQPILALQLSQLSPLSFLHFTSSTSLLHLHRFSLRSAPFLPRLSSYALRLRPSRCKTSLSLKLGAVHLFSRDGLEDVVEMNRRRSIQQVRWWCRSLLGVGSQRAESLAGNFTSLCCSARGLGGGGQTNGSRCDDQPLHKLYLH